MVQIFAAVDATGAPRFIGDVPRGAACGCICTVCGAPLVAKQGEINEWHFAHEGGQERPQCLVGALNLLRRLAVEEMPSAHLAIAPYEVAHPVAGHAPLRWSDQPVGDFQGLSFPTGPDGVAGTVQTRRCGPASVHVVIGRELWPGPGPAGQPVAVLTLPEPSHAQVRNEVLARAFVRQNMRLIWAWLPDVDGLLALAYQQLRDIDAERQRRATAFQAQRAREAGQLWAGIRFRAFDPRAHHAPPPIQTPAPTVTPSSRPRQPMARPFVAWAPGLAGDGSIQFRRLRDGTQWVYYPAAGHWRVAPVPYAFDGWDEYFPPSVAVQDGPSWLRVVDDARLLNWISPQTAASRIDSEPAVIEAQFDRS